MKQSKPKLHISTLAKKDRKDMTLKERQYLEKKHVQRCDNVFSKYIRLRDKCCVLCGSADNIQCSHLYTKKAHKSVRWDERNAYAMCASCHMKHHHIDQYQYLEWVKDYLGDEYDLFKLKVYSTCILDIDDLIDIELYYATKLEALA